MKCPWYRENICYSPKTLREYGEPSSKPVVDSICSSSRYVECPYYSEQRSSEQSQLQLLEETSIGAKEQGLALYLKVHTIPSDLKSDCPFYQIRTLSDQTGNTVAVAYCSFLERYLTRSAAEKCLKYWRDCPYYKIRFLQE